MDYKSAGVDIDKGDEFVSRIKKFVKRTYNAQVVSGVGGFAALYDIGNDKYLASGTDGVGTKLKLAQELNKHDTIGQDLVGMCVNDILCCGARPLFFLDYLATGKLKLEVHEKIVESIANACYESQCVLIGGETAEMPGFYKDEEYDLAGFAVGEVYKKELITGDKLKSGDAIIGIASSGFHSNGYSLVRKMIQSNEKELKLQCLEPTRLYVKLILDLIKKYPAHVKGLAHITGSGYLNIPRINEDFGYDITAPLTAQQLPPAMRIICERTKLNQAELHRTFNMGIGFVVVTDMPKEIMKCISSVYQCWQIGEISNKFKGIKLQGEML